MVKEKIEVMESKGKYEWTADALSTIIKLNNIIGFLPIDLDSTLKAVVNEIYNLFYPQTSCIYLLSENNTLELAAFKTSDGLTPDVHINPTIELCAALRDSLPYLACSATSCSATICPNRKAPEGASISHACIPLITTNEAHGVLSISFQPERILSRDKLNVLLSIANQVSLVIQRYRLFENLKKEKIEIEKAYREIVDLNKMLKRNIEELEETQQKLIHSEKLAATGELSARLCHEINNPMSIILNRIQCLKMESTELSLPSIVLKDLDVISSYASRVSSLVQDLLIFSRYHSSEFDSVDIKALLERVTGILKDEADRSGCKIHIGIPSNIPEIYGDVDKLEQVFRNLVANAIDAMPHGGNIYLETEESLEKPDFLKIKVRDGGEGIQEENLHRIFDPFFTTKKLGKGSGLGLSICYGIIKNHGGDIKVKSVLNNGSVFTVYLPIRGISHNVTIQHVGTVFRQV